MKTKASEKPFWLLSLALAALLVPLTLDGQKLTTQRGNASYYHDRFHGRRMANGEPYNKDSMTCAHLRYPLGTWLRVRNLTNNKEVIVQVTDRGPYGHKFVIDLSRAAARALDIIQYGYRMVEITPYVPGRVPYKYEPPTERPELDLGYTTDLAIGAPYWQDDSIYLSRHRLSRTAVVHLDADTLQATIENDTTLRHRALKQTADKKEEHEGEKASEKQEKASEKPEKTKEKTEKPKEKAENDGQKPAAKPAAQTEKQPSKPEQKPAKTEQKPAKTEQKPAKTEQKPAKYEQKPAKTEKQPSKPEQKPAKT